MRISDAELHKVMNTSGYALVEGENGFITSPREGDEDLIKQVVADVIAMPDREEMIADIKARVDAGTYNVPAADIADVMVRRAIADRIR